MYLTRNRNATYYSRIYIPLSLQNKGFPSEIRFSLGTTNRYQAIDRNLVVSFEARRAIKTVSKSDTPKIFKERLSAIVETIRKQHFTSAAADRVTRARKPKVTKAKHNPDFKTMNKDLLNAFIFTKRSEGIKNRSIQQLESRVSHYLSQLGMSVLNVTPREAMEYRDSLLNEGRSRKTNVEYLAAVKQFYHWLSLRGDCKVSPFERIKLAPRKQAPHQDRPRWSREQLLKLFRHKKFTQPYDKDFVNQSTQTITEDFWLPLVLLHTGARIGEICQLRTNDVFEKNDLWLLSINDDGDDMSVKTPSSVRLIPVHPYLIELGFIRYCLARKKAGNERLFDLRPIGVDKDWGKQFARRFERVITESGFIGKNRPTLHSFRHTFIDELQQKGIPENVVAELVGHTKKGITYGRYGKSMCVNQLYKALIAIELDLGMLGKL